MKKSVVFVLVLVSFMMLFGTAVANELSGIPLEVIWSNAVIRTEPSDDSEVILEIKFGDKLEVMVDGIGLMERPEDGYYHVSVPETEQTGWISWETVVLWPNHLIVQEDGVKLFSSRQRTYCMGRLKKGDELIVLEETKLYWCVAYNAGSFWLPKTAAVVPKECEE